MGVLGVSPPSVYEKTHIEAEAINEPDSLLVPGCSECRWRQNPGVHSYCSSSLRDDLPHIYGVMLEIPFDLGRSCHAWEPQPSTYDKGPFRPSWKE